MREMCRLWFVPLFFESFQASTRVLMEVKTARLQEIGLVRTTLLVPLDTAIMSLPRKPYVVDLAETEDH